MQDDVKWMQHALSLASHAEKQNEVPVGAVLVLENQILGEGWNSSISACDPTAHAEVMALRLAAQKIKNYRLRNSTLYVTLEPCAMCVGAIIHARVKRVVFGAFDLKSGAVESVLQLRHAPGFNHLVEYQGGLLEIPCGEIVRNFFRPKRK